MGDPETNLARVICCFLLHVTLLSEITSARAMLSFAKKNPIAFKGQSFEFPMFFATFKLLGGAACFCVNALIMLRAETIEDVIKDFVAAQIITQVDDLMNFTVSTEDSVENMDLLISNKRMRRDDWYIIKHYIWDMRNAEE